MTGTSLFLTGYRGTGKTSVGRLLAPRLSLPLVDLDERVQERDGRTIREIFSQGGEESFRDLESAALQEVVAGAPAVVALGGGAILRASNRELIRTAGLCVWLDADAQTLAARIEGDAATALQRPALTDLPGLAEVHEVLTRRLPLYQDAATFRVDTTDKSAQQVADEVLQWIGRADA